MRRYGSRKRKDMQGQQLFGTLGIQSDTPKDQTLLPIAGFEEQINIGDRILYAGKIGKVTAIEFDGKGDVIIVEYGNKMEAYPSHEFMAGVSKV